MNQSQVNTLKMYYVFTGYMQPISPAIINAMPHFSDYYAAFLANSTLLDDQYKLQMSKQTGYSEIKSTVRDNLCTLAVEIAEKISAYASNGDNLVLLEEMHFTYSDLRRCSEPKCKVDCETIWSKGVLLVDVLEDYGVTESLLAFFRTRIDTYISMIPQTQLQIDIKKMATSDIKQLFKDTNVLLVKMDRLALILKPAQAAFVHGYFESREVTKVGYYHLSARFTFEDGAGNRLSNVLLQNAALGLERRSAKKGNIYLKGIETNVYVFSCSLYGYVSQTVTVNIEKGLRADVLVVLVPES